jgi:hypothetical protein
MKKIRVYALAVKYWFQGDDWKFAKEYAESLVVKGWK